ncbi:hypothetical protein ACFJIV_28930 [Mucilaginibacter sp. UC70_90]
MSKLSDQTCKKAIIALASCLQHFEKLATLEMNIADAIDAKLAENFIRSIIETNGYQVIAGKQGTRLQKQSR